MYESTYSCGSFDIVSLCKGVDAADKFLHLLHLVQPIERMMWKRQMRVGYEHVLAGVLMQQVQQ